MIKVIYNGYMAGQHRKPRHNPFNCDVCRGHARELSTDLAIGLGTILLPMVLAESFDWSRAWWGATAGVLGRRAIVIVITYIIEVLMPKRKDSEEEESND